LYIVGASYGVDKVTSYDLAAKYSIHFLCDYLRSCRVVSSLGNAAPLAPCSMLPLSVLQHSIYMLHWHPNKEHICCSDKSFPPEGKRGRTYSSRTPAGALQLYKGRKKTSRREKGNPFPVFDFIQVMKGEVTGFRRGEAVGGHRPARVTAAHRRILDYATNGRRGARSRFCPHHGLVS
jgi:hypothetical protein